MTALTLARPASASASSSSSRRWLVAISLVAHGAAALALFISGVWTLERLEGSRPRRSLGLFAPTGDDGGGHAGAAPPAAAVALVPKVKVKRLVQPVRIEKVEAPVPPVTASLDPGRSTSDGALGGGDGDGDGDGDGAGPGTGGGGGECLVDCGPASPSPAPPAPPAAPQIVPPSVLTGLRLSGETQIVPADSDKTAMIRDGRTKSIGSFKVCIDRAGAIASITTAASTKYPAYDARILAAVRAWRYQPYRVNGAPAPACSMVTFVYSLK